MSELQEQIVATDVFKNSDLALKIEPMTGLETAQIISENPFQNSSFLTTKRLTWKYKGQSSVRR